MSPSRAREPLPPVNLHPHLHRFIEVVIISSTWTRIKVVNSYNEACSRGYLAGTRTTKSAKIEFVAARPSAGESFAAMALDLDAVMMHSKREERWNPQRDGLPGCGTDACV